MDEYDKWAQPALREELAKRELPTSGTNPEMVARLREHDAANPADDDLLGDDDAARIVAAPPPAQVAPQAPQAPAAPPAPEPEREQPKTFRVAFDVRGELSTSNHEDNRYRAYQAAIDAGYSPRGGLAAAYRVGVERGSGGTNRAVYEVILAR